MIRAQPMIAVSDVEAASSWFCSVVGLRSGHGGLDYEMLMDGDMLVAQLHRWDAHEHPHLGSEADTSRGNGVLLWFVTDDFESSVARVQSAKATVLVGPRFNPNGKQHEIWIEGPEGYRVVIAGPRT